MQLSQTREERFLGLDEFTYETRYAGSSILIGQRLVWSCSARLR